MKIKRSSELRSVSAEAEGVRLIWLFGGWVGGSEKKKQKPTRPTGPQFQTLLSLQCAAAAGCLCPCSLFPLFVVREGDNDRLQTSRAKMSRASKVVREGVLVGQFSPSRGVRLAGPQLASAMVSMTCSSLPRSRCLRDCSSFCNADRISSLYLIM